MSLKLGICSYSFTKDTKLTEAIQATQKLGVRAININVEECVTDRERTLRELQDQIRRIVAEDGAEVVILACAGLCGYDAELSRLAGIPVLDPAAVGVKVAESLVGLGLAHSKIRKFAPPPQPLESYL